MYKRQKTYFEKIGVSCPKCGKDIVIRKTQKGRKYYGCEDNPECDFMTWQRPSGKNCPKCGNALLIKGQKLVCADVALSLIHIFIPGQGKWCGLLGRDTEYIIGWKCVRQIGADIILVDVCMEEIMRRCEG